MDPPSAIPSKETKTAKATQFYVTSIADVCMIFPSGIEIFANVSVLRNASPVFRAMMDPQFQERQAIINNTGSTQEIEFPEDGSEVMLTLARLLHHREIELSNKLKAKHIYEVAVLADKYDVCHVVKSALATLPIQRDNWKNMCPNMWYLLTAAFIVGHRGVFTKMSTEQRPKVSAAVFAGDGHHLRGAVDAMLDRRASVGSFASFTFKEIAQVL